MTLVPAEAVKNTNNATVNNTNMTARKRKKINWLPLLIIPVLAAIIFLTPLGKFLSQQFFGEPSENNLPAVTDIGINIPAGYSVHGIDVSRYQLEIDWERVKNYKSDDFKVDFVLIKATEGTSLRDPNFGSNWNGARLHNFKQGAYHYFHPHLDPETQANFFVNTVNLQSGDIIPVLDIEEFKAGMTVDEVVQSCLIWLRLVERNYGKKPLVYTSAKFYDNYFAGTEIDQYPVWIAHYHVNSPETKAKWAFWQHSDRAQIDGIEGDVDANVFKGSINELENFLLP
jgi:lysozyme